MDQYHAFAIAAVLLACIRYGTYFHSIYLGKTKPHAFSWLLWSILTGIGAAAQFQLEGGPSAWALAFVAITCLIIAILAFFIGEKDYKKSDWIALFTCLIAIPIWQYMGNAVYALAIIIIIDALSYWPTVRKTWSKPETEPPISCFLAGLRYFLILFSIPEPTWENLLYPFFLMTADWSVAAIIVVRRAQLGHPLHEYQKNIKDVKEPSL